MANLWVCLKNHISNPLNFIGSSFLTPIVPANQWDWIKGH